MPAEQSHLELRSYNGRLPTAKFAVRQSGAMVDEV